MTELTPREVLDAIRRGLEETWRRLDAGKAGQNHAPGQPPEECIKVTDRDGAAGHKP